MYMTNLLTRRWRWTSNTKANICHTSEKVINVTSKQQLLVLVELRNHDHLEVAYGTAFARAALTEMLLRLNAFGGKVYNLTNRRFFVDLDTDFLLTKFVKSVSKSGSNVISNLELAFATTPFDYKDTQALLVVSIERVALDRWNEATALNPEIHELRGLDAPPSHPAPCQYGLIWQSNYQADMKLALFFIESLAKQQAKLVLQPIAPSTHTKISRNTHSIYCNDDNAWIYYEALVRFEQTTENPPINAGTLIPALERLGLIQWLDLVVLSSAIEHLRNDLTLHIGCNLSSLSLIPKASWWNNVFEKLQSHPSVACRLTLEITETAPISDLNLALSFLKKLRQLGCHIAIDDFGCGHTRLDFVRAVKPDLIKVSGKLIQSAAADRNLLNELKCFKDLASSLSKTVIAEGIEGPAELSIAEEIGFDGLQGYGIARPSEESKVINLKLPG